MQFVASLLPIIIYILVVYKIDHFALVNKRRLLQLVVGGMLMALVCFGLFSWLEAILKWCLEMLHRVISNWGICIIVLTIILKALTEILLNLNMMLQMNDMM